jgi:hypothetical protein
MEKLFLPLFCKIDLSFHPSCPKYIATGSMQGSSSGKRLYKAHRSWRSIFGLTLGLAAMPD